MLKIYSEPASYEDYVASGWEGEYLDFMEKINALGEETMNDAEAKYYLDVTLRVAERYESLLQ